ncbi:MAG: arginine--tRNA ligase [Nitrospira sp.]|nr:arginine--tRNA ligase [Nitrospira sp.]MDH4236977.1 arginine--tRNA ligase [Nitrospira sp.]MDH4328777.1 arginine--tRNA ligase [Nitrospira sp.]MDH5253790.1 arginine--tRNA ligase [Nitrospira sp.]MDH5624523.1 arginine--tRNA ligase [Nitrospira sp.]
MSQGVVQEMVATALLGALDGARKKGQLKTDAWPALTLDAPKRPEWGDLASTVAMSLASSEQRAPHDIAQIIVENLPRREQLFERVEIVRPGFLNLTVKASLWQEVLKEIESYGTAYGKTDLGRGRRVLVEYVSANPTGPLHVGHGRGAAVGQAVARLLEEVGYDVDSEYYINDAGRQMKLLGASVYARYRELSGQPVEFPEDGYHGAYITAAAERIKQQLGETARNLAPADLEERCRALAYQDLLAQIREDLNLFGIEFKSWFSEASLLESKAVEQVLDELKSRGLLFEQEGAWWFRSSAFGDEKDRVVKKQDGEYTYLASDIAYHRDKLRRGYDLLIDVWGADHHGYIPRMQAVMQAYDHPKERLHVVLVQLVKLLRAGAEVKMSKRTGSFVTMREVIDEVGADAAKFFFLMRDSRSHLDFDLDLAKQRSADNPMYYVQYAHARISSLWRVAAARGMTCPPAAEADLSVLTDPDELGLIRKLSAYPELLQTSASAFEPHRVTYYLQQLAALLHTFYNKHRILPPAVGQEPSEAEPAEELTPKKTAARLVLMRGVQQVIRNGLAVLGISAPEQM